MVNQADESTSTDPVASAFAAPNATLLLHALMSQLQDGVVVLDENGFISLMNAAAQRMVPLRSSLRTPFLTAESWGAFRTDRKTLMADDEFPVKRTLAGEHLPPITFIGRPAPSDEGLWIQATCRALVGPNQTPNGCVVILHDMTERKQLEKDLLDVSGAEKNRMGEELHDGVCQILTGIKFMCNVLRGKLLAKEAPEAKDVAEIQSLVSQALMEADLTAKGMFPVKLEADGLTSALEDLASQTARLYRISCRFICEAQVLILNRDVALNVYRIAQEAVANSVKHGRARNIVLWLTHDGARFTLLVKDDGRLPSQSSSRRGMGRRIMSARADQINGTLQIEYSKGGGTHLTCEFCDLSS